MFSDWISWARETRRKGMRWEVAKAYFTDPAEEMTGPELDAEIVQCFVEHDVESLPDMVEDKCHLCGVSYDGSDVQFYQCHHCNVSLCADCEERRVNFK